MERFTVKKATSTREAAVINLVTRPETLRDRDAIWQVNQAAFGGVAEADLVNALRDSGQIELSYVAQVDDTVVAHVLLTPLSIDTPGGTVEALSLAPMAVLPSYQRQGIGSRLLSAALAALRDSDHRIVLVLGHPAFYRRFGFSAERAAALESPFGGGEAWMALELVEGATDGIEGRVHYPPPFFVLM